MHKLEIIMRGVCFCMGILLACSTNIRVRDAGTTEILANVLLAGIWLCAVVALLVLPWALPLINK